MIKVTLLLTRGLPGSGKSTFSENLVKNNRMVWKRINKDILRNMLDATDRDFTHERHLNEITYQMIEFFLSLGFDVVSDNMNLDRQHIAKAVEIAERLYEKGILVEIKTQDFYTPLEVCIERDAKRPVPVTEEIIRKIYNLYYVDGQLPDVSQILREQPYERAKTRGETI